MEVLFKKKWLSLILLYTFLLILAEAVDTFFVIPPVYLDTFSIENIRGR